VCKHIFGEDVAIQKYYLVEFIAFQILGLTSHIILKFSCIMGAFNVPLAVFRGFIEFEDFWCHRRVKMSSCVTLEEK
jgi:hypothetical protein